MQEFLTELSKPLLLFAIGVIVGIAKAYMRQSVISAKEELISYHKYIAKPMIWAFIIMAGIVLLIGFAVGSTIINALQKAVVVGLYPSVAVYIFMIWGANLIRK